MGGRAISCCPNPDGHTPLPQIIAFDELRTDFKNPIDQGNPARAVSDTCAVPRCVRPSVFPYVAGGGRREDGKTGVCVGGGQCLKIVLYVILCS